MKKPPEKDKAAFIFQTLNRDFHPPTSLKPYYKIVIKDKKYSLNVKSASIHFGKLYYSKYQNCAKLTGIRFSARPGILLYTPGLFRLSL